MATVRPLIIGIAGPSGSAKTTICERICNHPDLRGKVIHTISCDSYYRTPPKGFCADTYNFDDPCALDFDLLAEHLRALRRGEEIHVPCYSFLNHCRDETQVEVKAAGASVILVEGIFAFCNIDVVNELDIKMFTRECMDICLVRRVRRDINERGRELMAVLDRYEKFVKPGYINFIKPSMRFADMIIPDAGVNNPALIMLVKLIASGLNPDEVHDSPAIDFTLKTKI